MTLTQEEQIRYDRQILLKEIGIEGQIRIKQAKVLVTGAGGLGSPVLLYLAAAGIGHLGIIDDDLVSVSNLQRQILYDTNTISRPKVIVAKEKLTALNPACKITTYNTRLQPENAREIISQYDIIVDATDNFPTRYLLDNVCASLHIPMVHGSIGQFTGQVAVFHYQGGPAYQDLYAAHEDADQSQQPSGVIGTLPGIVGCIQANEVLKIILQRKDVLSGKLLTIDLLNMNFMTFTIQHSTPKQT